MSTPVTRDWFVHTGTRIAIGLGWAPSFRTWAYNLVKEAVDHLAIETRGIKQPYLLAWHGVTKKNVQISGFLFDVFLQESRDLFLGSLLPCGLIETEYGHVFMKFERSHLFEVYYEVLCDMFRPYVERQANTENAVPLMYIGKGFRSVSQKSRMLFFADIDFVPTHTAFGTLEHSGFVPVTWCRPGSEQLVRAGVSRGC